MKERKRLLQGMALGCLLTLAVSFGIRALPPKEGMLDTRAIADKVQLLQELIDRYYYFDKDLQQVETSLYKGLVWGLGDIYSDYYDPQETAEVFEESDGNYCGIGVLVNQSRETMVTSVQQVFANSPAQEAGILPGDILLAVDGTDVSQMELSTISGSYILGEEGTQVSIRIYRPDTAQELDLTATRRQVQEETVTYRLLEGQVGYLHISRFASVTAQQFTQGVDALLEQGAQSLLFDLRDCPGGVLDSALAAMDYLLPDDLLLYTQDKQGNRLESYTGSDGHQVDLPMAVLLNGDSASAAECFASALRDYEAAVLVGETSYGKGIVQSIIPLKDGSSIKLTTSAYFTKSGYAIHGNGLVPDVAVEQTGTPDPVTRQVPIEQDSQLQAALTQLGALQATAPAIEPTDPSK